MYVILYIVGSNHRAYVKMWLFFYSTSYIYPNMATFKSGDYPANRPCNRATDSLTEPATKFPAYPSTTSGNLPTNYNLFYVAGAERSNLLFHSKLILTCCQVKYYRIC